MNIYVASSWRNNHQQHVVATLRALGHDVYDFQDPPGKTGFHWSDIDRDWEKWSTEEYRKALNNPIAIEGFNSDFNAMQAADACILVLPCGRSAHTEAGWMKGSGKPVFIYAPEQEEPELMYKIYNGVVSDMKELIELFIERDQEEPITPETINEMRRTLYKPQHKSTVPKTPPVVRPNPQPCY